MILRLLGKIFYNPRLHARKLPFVQIGPGSLLLDTAAFRFRLGSNRFTGQVQIGSRTMIGCELVFESAEGVVQIGDRCFLNGGTRLICRESISIGSDVTIAWDCVLYDHNSHSLDWRDRQNDLEQQFSDLHAGRNFIAGKNWSTVKSRPIVIEDKAWLGFGVTVLNGVRIGEGAIISARSVVREDVPAWTIVAGNPATVIGKVRQ